MTDIGVLISNMQPVNLAGAETLPRVTTIVHNLDEPRIIAIEDNSRTIIKNADKTVLTSHVIFTAGGGGGVDDGLKHPGVVFGNGVDATSLVQGQTIYLTLPYGGVIQNWSIVASDDCSCEIDIWKSSTEYPTVADSITGSAPCILASQDQNTSSTLTGWSTTLVENDRLAFNLKVLLGSPKQITLNLDVVT